MKIGELAKRTGCPVETIRYYEREGLLQKKKKSQACGILRELEQPAPLSPIPEECAEAGHMHVPGVHRRHG